MIVYEDGALIARLVADGAAAGHVTVEPRTDAEYLDEVSGEVRAHLFTVASFVATAVFEGLGAQGTNILCVEGTGKLHIHILPRFQDDGIDLFWEPNRADPGDLQSVASRVKDELWYVGKEKEPERVAEEVEQPPVENVGADPDKDYRLLHLRRSP